MKKFPVGPFSRSKMTSLYGASESAPEDILSPSYEMSKVRYLGQTERIETNEWGIETIRLVPKFRFLGKATLRSKGYTWREKPLLNAEAQRIVMRTVSSKNSAANSWIYPPKTWVRVKRSRSKKHPGQVIGQYVHTTPARDMKPGLLQGRPFRIIPVRLTPEMIDYLMKHGEES